MSKEEIALELTKLSFDAALLKVKERGEKPDSQKVVVELYNYIFENLTDAGHDE